MFNLFVIYKEMVYFWKVGFFGGMVFGIGGFLKGMVFLKNMKIKYN